MKCQCVDQLVSILLLEAINAQPSGKLLADALENRPDWRTPTMEASFLQCWVVDNKVSLPFS